MRGTLDPDDYAKRYMGADAALAHVRTPASRAFHLLAGVTTATTMPFYLGAAALYAYYGLTGGLAPVRP
jgi:hypothetical protein